MATWKLDIWHKAQCQRAQVESIFRSPVCSVHRWQAHLPDEGPITRVCMEKVESGVRLNQQQQEWIAFIYTLLEQGKSFIVLAEPPVQVCEHKSGNSPG